MSVSIFQEIPDKMMPAFIVAPGYQLYLHHLHTTTDILCDKSWTSIIQIFPSQFWIILNSFTPTVLYGMFQIKVWGMPF